MAFDLDGTCKAACQRVLATDAREKSLWEARLPLLFVPPSLPQDKVTVTPFSAGGALSMCGTQLIPK